jgi:hypothetical protein
LAQSQRLFDAFAKAEEVDMRCGPIGRGWWPNALL